MEAAAVSFDDRGAADTVRASAETAKRLRKTGAPSILYRLCSVQKYVVAWEGDESDIVNKIIILTQMVQGWT
jgi:hypothetical protein